jgi:hypothetical protein
MATSPAPGSRATDGSSNSSHPWLSAIGRSISPNNEPIQQRSWQRCLINDGENSVLNFSNFSKSGSARGNFVRLRMPIWLIWSKNYSSKLAGLEKNATICGKLCHEKE